MRPLNKLLACAMALMVPLCTWAQTESEPNDNIANANTVSLGVAMNGDMGGPPCVTGTSDDFFSLNLMADGQLTINTNTENTGTGSSTIRIDVYNSGGSQITWFTHATGPAGAPSSVNTTVNCLNKGLYYFRVQRGNASLCYTYALTLTLTAPLFADDIEPNNNAAQADANPLLAPAAITEGHVNFSHYGDNADFYRIETPVNGTLSITTTSEAVAAGNIRIDIYNGSVVQTNFYLTPVGTDGTPATHTQSYNCYGAGVYYLRVISNAPCGVSYQLSYSVTPPLFANDLEDNDNFSQADANPILPHGSITEGHLNFSHYGDNFDFYRIQTPTNGTLNITTNSEAFAAGDLRIDVYNGTGSQTDWYLTPIGTGGTPASHTRSFSCYGAGDYYVRVFSNGPCGVSYQLSYTVTAPVFGNDMEPNNSLPSAVVFNPDSSQAEGHLNFANYGDNNDFYKIVLPAAGSIAFGLLAEAATAGSLRVDLYNSGGGQVTWTTFPIGGDHVPTNSAVNFVGLPAGIYYLRAISANSCGVSYRFLCNDTDADGTCNYFDLCPGGPEPGTPCDDGSACTINDVIQSDCGCDGTPVDPDDGDPCTLDSCDPISGVSNIFQDADNDGTCDFFDGCPNDPNKIAPGQCGCGVPDTDTDGDLTADCNDGCPNDPNKIAPGICGCGVSDVDTDNDGTADCIDACPLLPNLVNGDPCDDGNANTVNDVVTNCICAGTLLNDDCEGVPGGPAQPGTACNDNNDCTINDVYDANCNCAGTFQDSDSDGVCDANDACPLLPNLVNGDPCDDGNANTVNDVVINCICAGTLLNDDCEGVPGGPAQPGTACNDNNDCTINDVYDANCNCAGTFQDSDSDGVCDANDACPLLPNLVNGDPCDDGNANTVNDVVTNCICAGTLLNDDCEGVPGGPAQPGTACNDNNDCTINDVYDANCNCDGTLQDTDSDGVCDADDTCPTVPGQIGSACNDGNASTINDQLDGNCNCVGTPVGPGCDFNEVELVVVNDAVSSVQWEVRAQGTGTLIANGAVNPPAGTYTLDICLPDGCYYLVVTDDGGDGIAGGGYVLRLATGERLIDNTGNMTVGVSQIAANEGFCLPLGEDKLLWSSCDKTDWRQNQFVVANPNAAVSAQFGASNANSGYQMWWFDPNGGYSFKRFQSHNTTNGLAANATRACHFQVNGWSGNQLQPNVLYNVKVRGRVAGTYLPWGRACRFVLDPLRAQCPLTKLMDIPNNQYLSCGQSRNWGAGNWIAARPVSRLNANGGTQNANRYQFRFRLPDESVVTVRTATTYLLQLNWGNTPLQPGNTYLVDVRASFDGGATWCTDFIQPSVDPWGEFCTLTIIGGSSSMNMENASGEAVENVRMALYPNPNQGDQLMLSLSAVAQGVQTVSVDLFDLFGKRVAARTIPVQDGFVNTMLELNGELANGLYMVSITAGADSYTERLVIQR
ncbi:MAG: T9SS type A sorting domain-containing protein [Flavobacteriales bacterium]|nr:MAG: T9SS type A sorting domain-containing protein [Flavobacteriales bacterium]